MTKSTHHFLVNSASLATATLLIVGCASILKHKDSDKILQNQEYDNAVHVTEMTPTPTPVVPGAPKVAATPAVVAGATPAVMASPTPSSNLKAASSSAVKNKKSKKKTAAADALASGANATPVAGKKEPDIEDADGFTGRRPNKDPFHVGEETTLELSYLGVVAGDLQMQVLPFVEVNGKKSYHLKALAHSTSVFAMFYAVDDWAETFLDFETMIPSSYKLAVKESKQLRDTREFFDWGKLKGFYWDKKINKDNQLEEKKIEWPILPYSQNLISSAYYLRTFALKPGQSYKYRVAYEGKNMVVTAEVLRRETIETELGSRRAIVVKPTFQIDGVFSPTGEIFFWFSDDDRKNFLRIEAKIKIGKIVGQVKSLNPGQP